MNAGKSGRAKARPRESREAMPRLRRDKRGALTTEYVILVGVVGIGFMFSLITVGPVLLRNYSATRTLVAAPFP